MMTFEDLLAKLEEDGVNPAEIATIIAEVSKASALKLYTQTMAALTEEQLQQVDETKDPKAVDALLEAFYELHYDQTAAAAIEEYQNEFAQKYSEEAAKQSTAPATA